MDKLIEALTLLMKYGCPTFPTHCEHDVLYVLVDPGLVSEDDIERLNALGFIAVEEEGHFRSYRYGSA